MSNPVLHLQQIDLVFKKWAKLNKRVDNIKLQHIKSIIFVIIDVLS